MPERPAQGNYLGFDFGEKYIGIAVGQTISSDANPLCILDVSRGIDWDKVSSIISEWKPAGLVVGQPLTADRKPTKLLKAVQKFTREIGERFELPVYKIDEHLSSRAAKDLLNHSTQRKMGRLDDMAAAVILQTWLHQQDDNN